MWMSVFTLQHISVKFQWKENSIFEETLSVLKTALSHMPKFINELLMAVERGNTVDGEQAEDGTQKEEEVNDENSLEAEELADGWELNETFLSCLNAIGSNNRVAIEDHILPYIISAIQVNFPPYIPTVLFNI